MAEADDRQSQMSEEDVVQDQEMKELDLALLDIRPFNFDEHEEVNEKYMSGEKHINIVATTIMFKVFVRILQNVS